MNLPDFQFLSAPLWLITALHILTLTLHFVAMNFLVGGLIIVVFGRISDRWEIPVVGRLVQLFPTAMAATVTLGVAPLLFLQLVYPHQVYSAAIVMGWFWLMIIPAVIMSYYLLYGVSFAKRNTASRNKTCLGLALLGLAYVSIVYSSVFSLAELPDVAKELYRQNQAGLAWNSAFGEYSLRWMHMILGALTLGGFIVGLLGKEDPEVFKVGKGFFFWGMVAAAIAGLAYLLTLGEYMVGLMRTPAIWALTLGTILSVGSLHFYFKRKFLPAGVMLFVSMITMVFSRHQVRLLKLEQYFDPASWRVEPQWSPFLVFSICFLIAGGILVYMLRIFFRPDRAGHGLAE